MNYSYDLSGNITARAERVLDAPQITAQPVNQIAAPGEMATFSVVVADARAVTFQWKRNGVDIAEATGDSLLLSNVKTEDDRTKYSVLVTNSAGSVTSEAAELLLDSDRDGLPDSWEGNIFKPPLDPRDQRSETDPDKDGISNLDEFLDGTDPTKKDSLRPRLTAYSDAGGSVAISPMKLSYDSPTPENPKGESVELTATAFTPSKFVGWAGDLKGTENPATVTMDRNKTVRARFASGPVPVPLGLIALWRGEMDASDLLGRHHGAFFIGEEEASPSVTEGKIGSAFNFDGKVYVRVDERDDDPAALRPARFTIEAWVFLSPLPGGVRFQTIIAKGSSTLDFNTWDLGVEFSKPRFTSHLNNEISGPAIPIDEWTHLAGTFDGKSKRLYVNGALVGRRDHSIEKPLGELVYDPAPVPVTIGSDWARNASSDRFTGRIDEVALYNRALTADEIRSIYNADFLGKNFAQPYFTSPAHLPDAVLGADYTHKFVAIFGTGPVSFSLSAGVLPPGITLSASGVLSGVPKTVGTFDSTTRATDAAGKFTDQRCLLQAVASIPAPAGLVGWWRAENNAEDSAGTNHGFLRNGAGFAAGRVGQAFALDGEDDFIEIPDTPSLRSVSVTLEAWVSFGVTSRLPVIIAKTHKDIRDDSYALRLEVGRLTAQPGDPAFAISAPFAPEAGSWHHLAYTFDNGNQQLLYIDGLQVASGKADSPIRYDDQPLVLGCAMQNGVRRSFLQGRIDEASIYNRALSDKEIASIFNAGAAGKTLD